MKTEYPHDTEFPHDDVDDTMLVNRTFPSASTAMVGQETVKTQPLSIQNAFCQQCLLIILRGRLSRDVIGSPFNPFILDHGLRSTHGDS